jgi:hypothetical protein
MIVCGVMLALLVAGCAGPNVLTGTAGKSGVAGFWAGLWHGLICPVAFVISLFDHHVRLYEVHNTGALYDLGFLLGAGSSLGGAGRGAHRGQRDH